MASNPQKQSDTSKITRCPQCETALRVPSKLLGKTLKCPRCNNYLSVSDADKTLVQPSGVEHETFQATLIHSLTSTLKTSKYGTLQTQTVNKFPCAFELYGGKGVKVLECPECGSTLRVHFAKAGVLDDARKGWKLWAVICAVVSVVLMVVGIVFVICLIADVISEENIGVPLFCFTGFLLLTAPNFFLCVRCAFLPRRKCADGSTTW